MDQSDGITPPRPVPTGRAFEFRCLRCASVLEARSSQSGHHARCPTCEAVFVVPAVDPASGLAITHADPGDDGQNPTPVHAYAAAGAKAPKLVRKDDDSLMIQCPRCQRESAVRADNCQNCGLPFTLEGSEKHVGTAVSASGEAASLVLGVVAIPLSFMGVIGLVPGILAIGTGLVALSRKRTVGFGSTEAGILLGLIACALSLVFIAYMS